MAPDVSFTGMDLEDPELQERWKDVDAENLVFTCGSAMDLPYEDGRFDVVSAIEVLEHVPDPDRALEEMCRVARRCLIVSVPREPVWRILNMARGSYVASWGNTPGHIHHWSRRGFVNLLERYGTVAEVRTPLPWTIALVRLEGTDATLSA
jgi:2-polyprenyl-3-methyl-5-hydroxy-6-metoxy-1,4-benzoquinol methylase